MENNYTVDRIEKLEQRVIKMEEQIRTLPDLMSQMISCAVQEALQRQSQDSLSLCSGGTLTPKDEHINLDQDLFRLEDFPTQNQHSVLLDFINDNVGM
jgi:hypothetical protein